jgi:hypothetical protein
LNDLVRVRIATRFLDGVAFLDQKLRAHLEEHGLRVDGKFEARVTGYYANHLYFDFERMFTFGASHNVRVTCEIQIATELSTQIWDKTHGAYELSREAERDDRSWQWNPDDPRFVAAQLAHMIHLADGLAVQLRDAVAKTRGKK